MTSLRFHSGAHMNDRMLTSPGCCRRRPAANRSGASLASIATRSRMTLVTIVRLSDALRRRAVAGAQHARRERLIGGIAQQQERALGRHHVEDQVDDA